MEFLWSSPTDLQWQIIWGLLFKMPTPRLVSLTWDSKLSVLWDRKYILWYNYFLVCRSSTWKVWDLIISWICPSYLLVVVYSLFLDVEYPFLVGCSLLCWWVFSNRDFHVFLRRGGIKSFYSAILFPFHSIIKICELRVGRLPSLVQVVIQSIEGLNSKTKMAP